MANPVDQGWTPWGFISKPVFEEAKRHCNETLPEGKEKEEIKHHFDQQIADEDKYRQQNAEFQKTNSNQTES